MDAPEIFADEFNSQRPIGDRWHGILGDFSGNIDAPLTGWKYVRIPVGGSGAYSLGMFPGLNISGTAYDTPVLIEWDYKTQQRVIIGTDVQTAGSTITTGTTVVDPTQYSVPHHANTHQLGGWDQIDVSPVQLTGIQVRPGATNNHVTVGGGMCIAGGTLVIRNNATATDVNLTAPINYVPATGVKYVWITITSANAVAVIDPSCTDITTLTLPATANYVAALVMLQASQPINISNLNSWIRIYDGRILFGPDRDWHLAGNAGISASVHWMGSSNDADVVFKRNSIEAIRLFTPTSGTAGVRVGGLAFPTGVATTYGGVSIIGQGSPAQPADLDIYACGNDGAISPVISGNRSTGTLSVPVTLNVDSTILTMAGKGYDGTAWSGTQARIYFRASEEWAVGAHGTYIGLWTTPTGSTTIAEHARLTRGSWTIYYDAANYASIQPGSACGTITWTPEISGAVIVRSATPNIVGGAFGATPGNARGSNAVDLQQSRAGATQVASGGYSTICGGGNNTASATCAAVLGGAGNTASGVNSAVLGGSSNIASGEDSVACGYNAQSTHTGTFVFSDSTAAVFGSVADGEFAIRVRGGFRHAYDSSNYWTAKVSSAGAVTFDAVGASAGFTFSDNVTVSGVTLTDTLRVGSGTGAYISDQLAASGADRLILRVGVSGVSNGFTVQYTHATTLLDYTFNQGTVSGTGNPAFKVNVDADSTALAMYHADGTTRKWQIDSVTHGFNLYMQGAAAYVLNVDGTTGAVTLSGAFGCNGAAAQAAYASGGASNAVSGTATSGGFGFVSAAEMNQFISDVNTIKTLANNTRTALINNGIES